MSDEVKREEKPLYYLIQYTKQTSMLGEAITVTKNLPADASEADLSAEFIKIGNALDNRMRDMNKAIKKLNGKDGKEGKGFEEMGLDPGTVYVTEEN